MLLLTLAGGGGGTLLLCGAYTIGKEKVFLQLARELRLRVYVEPAKLRVLRQLQLGAQDMARFTTCKEQAQLHIVPLFKLSLRSLRAMKKREYASYSSVVARPSPPPFQSLPSNGAPPLQSLPFHGTPLLVLVMDGTPFLGTAAPSTRPVQRARLTAAGQVL